MVDIDQVDQLHQAHSRGIEDTIHHTQNQLSRTSSNKPTVEMMSMKKSIFRKK